MQDQQNPFKLVADIRIKHGALFNYIQSHNMTIRSFTDKYNLPYQTILNYISLRSFPTQEYRDKLAQITGIDADELFPPWLRETIKQDKEKKRRFIVEQEVTPEMVTGYSQAPSLPSPDELFYSNEKKEALLEAIDEILKPRQKDLIIMRHGLDGGEPMTLKEVGQVLCVTQERVRQMEINILKKIKKHLGADWVPPESQVRTLPKLQIATKAVRNDKGRYYG